MATPAAWMHSLPELLLAEDSGQLKAQCQRLVQAIGLDFYLIAMERPARQGPPELVIDGTYPQAWLQRYQELQWVTRDPVVQHCRQSAVPLTWHRGRFSEPDSQRLFDEASAYGVSAGVATSLRGAGGGQPMLLSAACDAHASARTESWLQSITPAIHLLSSYTYEALRRLDATPMAQEVRLTAREKECLEWAAAGKSSWETSRILQCSEATVNFHIRNIVQKLNVSNRRQAVVRALSMGFISA